MPFYRYFASRGCCPFVCLFCSGGSVLKPSFLLGFPFTHPSDLIAALLYLPLLKCTVYICMQGHACKGMHACKGGHACKGTARHAESPHAYLAYPCICFILLFCKQDWLSFSRLLLFVQVVLHSCTRAFPPLLHIFCPASTSSSPSLSLALLVGTELEQTLEGHGHSVP